MSTTFAELARLLPEDERRPVRGDDVIPGMVPREGSCAIGAPTASGRRVLTTQIVRALRGDPTPVLEHFASTHTLGSVAILSTSRVGAQQVRGALCDVTGVAVYELRPIQPADLSDHMSVLRDGLSSVDAVIIDTVNHITNGNPPMGLGREVASLHRLVIGLYQGNLTSVGVGGEGLWCDADVRLHLSPKGELVDVDRPETVALTVTLPSPADALAPRRIATSEPDLTAEQVYDLGGAARFLNKHGGPDARASTLLTDALPSVRSICGREPAQAELARAIGQHSEAFDRGVRGRPLIDPPVPDEPPY